jgi:mono/diheme cytochrome c family protein
MTSVFLAFLIVVSGSIPALAAQARTADRPGNARAGKAFWESSNALCSNCHGDHGEGGFGPDLAGRAVSFSQFLREVRQPWGIMPRWTAKQISDRTLADVYAYMMSRPSRAEPAPWRVTVPRRATVGLRYFVETVGCGQCHGVELHAAITGAENKAPTFAWVAQRVYAHAEVTPLGKMGTYSRDRLPEFILREIWRAAIATPVKATIASRP